MNIKKTNDKLFWFAILHCLLFFLSLSGIVSKFASQQEFLSFLFLILYATEILILFTYTILWQQVLKHISLTTAFSNKAVGMIWSTLWGVLIFKEKLTLQMVIGAIIVFVGVLIVVKSDE